MSITSIILGVLLTCHLYFAIGRNFDRVRRFFQLATRFLHNGGCRPLKRTIYYGTACAQATQYGLLLPQAVN